MIASALEHSLKNVFLTVIQNKDTLRLFSDSCFGQNINVLDMLFRYSKGMSALDISYTFPITHHYKGAGCIHSLLKKGEKWLNLQPDRLLLKAKLQKLKKDMSLNCWN